MHLGKDTSNNNKELEISLLIIVSQGEFGVVACICQNFVDIESIHGQAVE